jgi:hypothetical protein
VKFWSWEVVPASGLHRKELETDNRAVDQSGQEGAASNFIQRKRGLWRKK